MSLQYDHKLKIIKDNERLQKTINRINTQNTDGSIDLKLSKHKKWLTDILNRRKAWLNDK